MQIYSIKAMIKHYLSTEALETMGGLIVECSSQKVLRHKLCVTREPPNACPQNVRSRSCLKIYFSTYVLQCPLNATKHGLDKTWSG